MIFVGNNVLHCSLLGYAMKKTKILVLTILLIVGFALNSELYQSYLTSFCSEYYYLDITPTDTTYDNLPMYLDEFAKKNKRPFFCVEVTDTVFGKTFVDIYCNDLAYEDLSENKQIYNGVFNSAISGKTEVIFHKFTDLKPTVDSVTVYFSAENYELESIHQKINKTYTSGYIHKKDTNGEKFFSICLWFLFGIIYLLFSGLTLQFQKKELFLKISLGYPKTKVILIEFIKDSSELIISILILKSFMSKFIYTDFNSVCFIISIIIVIVLNFSIYLSIHRINYKEILYGGNIGENTVANCYIVKVASMILTVLLLSMNIALIKPNINPLINSKYIESYHDFEFAKLNFKENSRYETEDMDSYYSQLLLDAYKSQKAIVSTNNTYMGEHKRAFISTNNLSFLIESGMNNLKDVSDYLIILPYDIESETEPVDLFIDCAYMSLESMIGVKREEIDVKICYAQKPSKALYLDLDNKRNAQLGYTVASNPVFIYCNTCNVDFSICDVKNISNSQNTYTLYEKDFLNSKTSYFLENGLLCENMSAKTVFTENRQSLIKTVFLSIVIILLQILLDVSLISALINVEYTANSVELALKKLMGYSVFKKNRPLIFLNIYSGTIGIMTSIIIFTMLSVNLKFVAVFAGFSVIVIEILILLLFIRRFEKKSIVKIIKGGVV